MVSKNVFFCMIFSGVGFKRIQCIDFIILSLQYWLCGFSSKKVRIFKFLYFLQSKIRNLTATKKHYQHCNVFRKSFFFCFCDVTKYLNTQHISFFNKENNENKLFTLRGTNFFCNATKTPHKHKILIYSIFKHKKNRKWKF